MKSIKIKNVTSFTTSRVPNMFPAKAPFHLLSKPIGPVCNLDCEYCFYLEKEELYPQNKSFRMASDTLETLIKQYIIGQPKNTPEVSFSWQGGEPTLMGIAFFEKALKLQQKHARSGMKINNCLQTNGTLLNDKWGKFLHDNNFLVGISIDGPEALHDHYRLDKKGRGSFKQVMRGIKICQKYQVEFNTLTVVQSNNADHPKEIYQFLKKIGSTFFQFIPLLESDEKTEEQSSPDNTKRSIGANFLYPDTSVGKRSVCPTQWGNFINGIFDEWVSAEDIGLIFVQDFDLLLSQMMGYSSSLCVNAETCGNALAVEHNGDLYSCDHFVEDKYRLGNLNDSPLSEMLESKQQIKFGNDKRDTLPTYCQQCDFLKLCWGGCPKDRQSLTPQGERGLNYLCKGYKAFYQHSLPTFQKMAASLRVGKLAKDWQQIG